MQGVQPFKGSSMLLALTGEACSRRSQSSRSTIFKHHNAANSARMRSSALSKTSLRSHHCKNAATRVYVV